MARLNLLKFAGAGHEAPPVETARLSLRVPDAHHFEEWATLRGASRDHLQPWEPEWIADELTRATYRHRLRAQHAAIAQGRSLPYLLFERRSETLVGGLTVSNIRRGVAQSATLGYWTGRDYVGLGYMSEAVEGTCAMLFRSLDLHRVEAATLPANTRSVALLERCGFSREGLARGYLKIAGRWQDHLLFARLSDDRRTPVSKRILE